MFTLLDRPWITNRSQREWFATPCLSTDVYPTLGRIAMALGGNRTQDLPE